MEGTIRPWFRSRLFWLGVPGLVFLMWGWWDSGVHATTCKLDAHTFTGGDWVNISRGEISLWVSADGFEEPLAQWEVSFERFPQVPPLQSEEVALRSETAGSRQFEIAPAFNFSKAMDEPLGENPAAAGWVPSPGSKLPEPEFKGFQMEVAFWFLVLIYLTTWSGVFIFWQRRKAHLMRLEPEISSILDETDERASG